MAVPLDVSMLLLSCFILVLKRFRNQRFLECRESPGGTCFLAKATVRGCVLLNVKEEWQLLSIRRPSSRRRNGKETRNNNEHPPTEWTVHRAQRGGGPGHPDRPDD